MHQLVPSLRRPRLLKPIVTLVLLAACAAETPQPQEDEVREAAIRESAVRAAAYLTRTEELVSVDVIVAMLVYAEVSRDDYVEERAMRRLRLLPESALAPFGVALGSDHSVVVEVTQVLETLGEEPNPRFALSDDRDQLCPLAALACETSAECDEYSGGAFWGYALTHQALELVFEHWAECAAAPEPRASRLAARLRAEARFDPEPSDLMSERMAMLGQLGYAREIQSDWIDALLASQAPSGAFLWAAEDEAHPHPTGMALWAFAGWLRSLSPQT